MTSSRICRKLKLNHKLRTTDSALISAVLPNKIYKCHKMMLQLVPAARILSPLLHLRTRWSSNKTLLVVKVKPKTLSKKNKNSNLIRCLCNNLCKVTSSKTIITVKGMANSSILKCQAKWATEVAINSNSHQPSRTMASMERCSSNHKALADNQIHLIWAQAEWEDKRKDTTIKASRLLNSSQWAIINLILEGEPEQVRVLSTSINNHNSNSRSLLHSKTRARRSTCSESVS